MAQQETGHKVTETQAWSPTLRPSSARVTCLAPCLDRLLPEHLGDGEHPPTSRTVSGKARQHALSRSPYPQTPTSWCLPQRFPAPAWPPQLSEPSSCEDGWPLWYRVSRL